MSMLDKQVVMQVFTSVKDVVQFSSTHSFVYTVVAFLGRRLLVLTVPTVDS